MPTKAGAAFIFRHRTRPNLAVISQGGWLTKLLSIFYTDYMDTLKYADFPANPAPAIDLAEDEDRDTAAGFAYESAGIEHLHIVKSGNMHPSRLLKSGCDLPGFRPSNRYALSYLESGKPQRYSQFGWNTAIGQGDLVLIDMQGSFFHGSDGGNGTTLFFLLDGSLVESALTDVGDFLARRIPGREGWGELLSKYVALLTPARLTELSADPDLSAILPKQIVYLLRNALLGSSRLQHESDGLDLRDHNAWELHGLALAWLQENFADQRITLPRLAAQLDTPLRRLQKAFSTVGNESALQALHRIRLEEAVRLLSDRHYRNILIPEIGRHCGFPSTATFYRLFIKAYGMPPAQYRRCSSPRIPIKHPGFQHSRRNPDFHSV